MGAAHGLDPFCFTKSDEPDQRAGLKIGSSTATGVSVSQGCCAVHTA
jgi:hypothetical protein